MVHRVLTLREMRRAVDRINQDYQGYMYIVEAETNDNDTLWQYYKTITHLRTTHI